MFCFKYGIAIFVKKKTTPYISTFRFELEPPNRIHGAYFLLQRFLFLQICY
jgi:hypothetical protein